MIEMRIKTLFFDTPKVRRAVDSAKRKVLSKAGAFIRTRARSSIRKRKASAPPGSPPCSHVGTLKRLIYFGYDPQADSVVVGPEKFGDTGAPGTLEFGGTTLVRRRRRRGGVERRRVRIAPHPFMGPALKAEKDNLPKLWAGSVRG